MDAKFVELMGRRLQIAIEHMDVVIDKICYRRNPIDLKGCYRTLSEDHIAIALHDYFVNDDIGSFKQHLYVASQLSLAACRT